MCFLLHHHHHRHHHRRRRRLWLTFDFEPDECGDDESDKFIVLALSRLETPCNKSVLLLSTQRHIYFVWRLAKDALCSQFVLFAYFQAAFPWPLSSVWSPSTWGLPRLTERVQLQFVCVPAVHSLIFSASENVCHRGRRLQFGLKLKEELPGLFNVIFKNNEWGKRKILVCYIRTVWSERRSALELVYIYWILSNI